MLPEFWSLLLIVAAAHGVQVVIGFGGSILALTFASLVAPVDTLLPLLVPLNLGVPLYLSVRYRRAVDREELRRRIIPFALIGLAMGFGLFLVIDGTSLTAVYAVFILVLASLRLLGALRERRNAARDSVIPPADPSEVRAPIEAPNEAGALEKGPPPSRSPSRLWIVGGGLCHGLFATGGPVLILYTAVALPDKQTFRCTMAVLWVILNSSLISGYAINGDLTPETLKATASLAPALLVGVFVGEAVHRRISQETFKILIYLLLLIAGGLILSRA